ncbi:hypothetical protein GCM10020258_60370 [Sphingomonas yabuuchiae]
MQLTVALVVRDRVAKLALDGATLLALLLLTVATWHGILSGLAACGGASSFIARTQRSTTRMKIVFLVAAPFWLAHNLLIGAPFALAVDLVSVAGICSGFLPFGSGNSVKRTGRAASAIRRGFPHVTLSALVTFPSANSRSQSARARYRESRSSHDTGNIRAHSRRRVR